MSTWLNRKSSILSYDEQQKRLKIDDDMMGIRAGIVMCIIVLPFWLFILMDDYNGFVRGFLFGFLFVIIPYLIFTYSFKLSTRLFVKLEEIDAIELIEQSSWSDNLLLIRLKNGRSRQVGYASEEALQKHLDFFKRFDIPVRHKKGSIFTPLNYY